MLTEYMANFRVNGRKFICACRYGVNGWICVGCNWYSCIEMCARERSQIHEMVLIEAKHDGFSVLSFLTFDLRFSFIRHAVAAVVVVIGR